MNINFGMTILKLKPKNAKVKTKRNAQIFSLVGMVDCYGISKIHKIRLIKDVAAHVYYIKYT